VNMAISEAARNDLYTGLRDILGPDRAEALMSVVPLHDFDEVATKRDIAELREATRTDMAGLRTEMKTDLADLRAELKTDLADLRAELKTDLADLRAELKTEMADLRTDVARLGRSTAVWGMTIVVTILGSVIGTAVFG
jgi:ribosomal protein L29